MDESDDSDDVLEELLERFNERPSRDAMPFISGSFPFNNLFFEGESGSKFGGWLGVASSSLMRISPATPRRTLLEGDLEDDFDDGAMPTPEDRRIGSLAEF